MNKPWGILAAACLFTGIATGHATNSVFFCRIVSTQQTRITSFNSDGTIAFSNAARSNARCRIEWSTSPSSRVWSADASTGWLQTTSRTHATQIPYGSLSSNIFFLQGTVVYNSFEGGFYGVTNSEGRFLPYAQWMIPCTAGARVAKWARLRKDLISVYQWGHIVELYDDPGWFSP